jgi:hypothetical protein
MKKILLVAVVCCAVVMAGCGFKRDTPGIKGLTPNCIPKYVKESAVKYACYSTRHLVAEYDTVSGLRLDDQSTWLYQEPFEGRVLDDLFYASEDNEWTMYMTIQDTSTIYTLTSPGDTQYKEHKFVALFETNTDQKGEDSVSIRKLLYTCSTYYWHGKSGSGCNLVNISAEYTGIEHEGRSLDRVDYTTCNSSCSCLDVAQSTDIEGIIATVMPAKGREIYGQMKKSFNTRN